MSNHTKTITLPISLEAVLRFVESAKNSELKAIQNATNAKLATQQDAVKQQIEKLLADAGMSIADVAPAATGTKGHKHAVRFRDPDNPDNHWSAIGSPPKWLAKKAGKVINNKVDKDWDGKAACQWACASGYLADDEAREWAIKNNHMPAATEVRKAA